MIGWTWLAGALAFGVMAVRSQGSPFQPRLPAPGTPSPGNGKYWRFLTDSSDEFSSPLSAIKWSRSFPGWGGNAPAAIVEDNAAVNASDGTLELTARLDPDHSFPDSDPSCACSYETYTVGLVRQRVELAPPVNGRLYVEIKARAAPAMVRSSIWLQGPSAEISAFEIQGMLADGTAAQTCETSFHVFNANATTESRSYSTAGISTTDFSVFGILIDTAGDGSVVTTVNGGGATVHTWFGGHDLASAELSLVMDVSINATMGLPADADLPAVFKVDHIRAFEEAVIEGDAVTLPPTHAPTHAPTHLPTPSPVTYCPEGFTNLPQRWNWGLGRVTIEATHQACADRCMRYAGVEYSGGCKGYQSGMYFGMLFCRSYGGGARSTSCAPWAQPDSNDINGRPSTVGGNCCTMLQSLESSSGDLLASGARAATGSGAAASASYAMLAVGVASIVALATVAARRNRATADIVALAANAGGATAAGEQVPLFSPPPALTSPAVFARYGTA